jgi:hypothetical protein
MAGVIPAWAQHEFTFGHDGTGVFTVKASRPRQMLCLFQPVLGKADQPAGLAPRIPSPGIAELLEAEVLFLCGPKNPRSSDAVDR